LVGTRASRLCDLSARRLDGNPFVGEESGGPVVSAFYRLLPQVGDLVGVRLFEAIGRVLDDSRFDARAPAERFGFD
jgi:hypothetical protein